MAGLNSKSSNSLFLKNSLPPYDMECPLAMKIYIGIGPDVPASLKLSQESGAVATIVAALDSNEPTDRKIVIVGDTHMRQIFSSLACIARSTWFWQDENSYTKAVYPPRDEYQDARVKLKDGFGEIFYSPTAGRIHSIDAHESREPIHGNEDWLQSCSERKPFVLDSYTYEADNVRAYFSENDPRFEKVPLSENDVVFFNVGSRGQSRISATEKLLELLDCMENARLVGEDPGWPQLSYFTSNHHHYQNVDAPETFHRSSGGTQFCLDEVDTETNQLLLDDKTKFGEHANTVGFDLDLGRSGNLHVGKGIHHSAGPNTTIISDCSSWTMPGVPDIFAKEIATSILSLPRLEN